VWQLRGKLSLVSEVAPYTAAPASVTVLDPSVTRRKKNSKKKEKVKIFFSPLHAKNLSASPNHNNISTFSINRSFCGNRDSSDMKRC